MARAGAGAAVCSRKNTDVAFAHSPTKCRTPDDSQRRGGQLGRREVVGWRDLSLSPSGVPVGAVATAAVTQDALATTAAGASTDLKVARLGVPDEGVVRCVALMCSVAGLVQVDLRFVGGWCESF